MSAMPGDEMDQPVVGGSPGGAHRLQELTNPAFTSPDEQTTEGQSDPLQPSAADMRPPLALEDFESLEDLDPAWLTWDETPIDVKAFYRTYDLPQVVKVDDGDYSNFGMGTHVDVARPFLLYTSRRCSKVLVANIYWDDSRQKYVEVGPRVVIPVNYPGWFYFLQDSGAVGKTLKSIGEVVALHPKAFLVRAAVPCYRRALQGRTKPTKNTTMRVYVRDQLSEGEVLNFDSIHCECVEQTKPACCLCWAFGKKTTTFVTEEQYLRCTDLDGHEVLLDLNLEGLFSPVGEPGTSSEHCVYQLADVVNSTDLPTHMKLCQGQPPSSPCSFTGLLRLEDVYLEETIIACTLGAHRHFMVEFPTDSEIKFILAADAYRYFDHPVIQKSMEECDQQIDGYVNSIKVVQSFYPEHIKLKDSASNNKKEEGKNVRSLPPLPSHPEGSHNESMDTTDDYTDDSDFSDYTEDEDNVSRSQIVERTEQHGNTIRSAVTIKLSNDPIIIYDDNYEEIPGDRPPASLRPSPPPIPIPVQTPVAVPPPPPMFDETFDDTYDIADHVPSLPPMVHASYSRAKLERMTSHPETVPVNDNEDIIAPPQRWSDADMDVPMTVHHPKLTPTVSDSINMFNGRSESRMSDSAVHGEPLGRQLRERLDAFLTDSVQELHRLQANGDTHTGRETPMSTVSADHITNRIVKAPKVPPKPKLGSMNSPQALQSHEDINAYLENIFNADSMTDEIAPPNQTNQNNLRSGTLPHPRGRHVRPVSVDTSTYRSVDDSFHSKPQYRVPMGHANGAHATLRRHNVKCLSLVQPTPANRPSHLPVHHNGTASAPVAPAHPAHHRENIFIPIRRPNSVSPPQDHSGGSSGEYPPDPASSPERDLGPNRADSGIFVSPRLSDFHLDLESPYGAPSEDPSWTPPSDLSPLSVTEIAHCLRYIGMKDAVVFRFVEEQIDGTLLQELDATLLKEGFPELNALERKKVLDFVGGWRPKKL